jgi:hypothetical protein
MQNDLGFNSDVFGAAYVICGGILDLTQMCLGAGYVIFGGIWDLTQIYLKQPT